MLNFFCVFFVVFFPMTTFAAELIRPFESDQINTIIVGCDAGHLGHWFSVTMPCVKQSCRRNNNKAPEPIFAQELLIVGYDEMVNGWNTTICGDNLEGIYDFSGYFEKYSQYLNPVLSDPRTTLYINYLSPDQHREEQNIEGKFEDSIHLLGGVKSEFIFVEFYSFRTTENLRDMLVVAESCLKSGGKIFFEVFNERQKQIFLAFLEDFTQQSNSSWALLEQTPKFIGNYESIGLEKTLVRH